MPLQATSGAASYDAFGGGVAAVPNYIEDVFSTYLYTGTGAMRSISNGIDLAGEGGLVWIKDRAIGYDHCLFDTARGVDLRLVTNSTGAQATQASRMVTAFNSDGFTLGNVSTGTYDAVNELNQPFASWTFRKQPKFFDVVTYTGNGVAGRQIAHNLGSVPGCIIVKSTSTATMWPVYHRSLGATKYLGLNTTDAQATNSAWWNNTEPTATAFTVGTTQSTNQNTLTYVAYIFAHNAGGFGLTGTDNVISCGSYTGGGTPEITLGYEPQWVLVKQATGAASSWYVVDSMRTFPLVGASNALMPNLSNAENGWFNANFIVPTSTGFKITYPAGSGTEINDTGQTYIYIAIRRGPMKVPTSGASVYSGILATSSEAAGTTKTTGFPIDFQLVGWRDTAIGKYAVDRLRSVNSLTTSYPSSSAGALNTTSTSAEDGGTNRTLGFSNTGFNISTAFELNNVVYWNFQRAPSFFDEVCYTGTGTSARQVTHNLGVSPNLLIVKKRSAAGTDWCVYCSSMANYDVLYLDLNSQVSSASPPYNVFGTNAQQTSTYFTLGGSTNIDFYNASGSTYVAYLFATCAGVSKVGSYTGTGTTKQIDCGFTSGARFVLIKRTDSTGDWYVWDSARGIVAGNDPYLLLNSSAAEVTTTDYIDTYSAGFEISSTAPAAINASGGTYIFLAIA